jgi:hypothetical protein
MTEHKKKYANMPDKDCWAELRKLRYNPALKIEEATSAFGDQVYSLDVVLPDGTLKAICINEPVWILLYRLADYNDSLKQETT